MNKTDTPYCTKCGNINKCTANENCWCAQYPSILTPKDKVTCFCSNCLKELIIEKSLKLIENKDYITIAKLGLPSHLIEDLDYYINSSGDFVFTSWYHLRRGECCGNECKHCPFHHKNVVSN